MCLVANQIETETIGRCHRTVVRFVVDNVRRMGWWTLIITSSPLLFRIHDQISSCMCAPVTVHCNRKYTNQAYALCHSLQIYTHNTHTYVHASLMPITPQTKRWDFTIHHFLPAIEKTNNQKKKKKEKEKSKRTQSIYIHISGTTISSWQVHFRWLASTAHSPATVARSYVTGVAVMWWCGAS